MNKTALVFGASGLVGGALVQLLIEDNDYVKIVLFNRRALAFDSPKIEEHILEVENVEAYKELVKGNVLYICLGTTIKKAGSVERMEQIDRDLPINIAKIASENDVDSIVSVSSVGANMHSRNNYLRMKGEMEKGLMDLPFKQVIIARPSMLLGERNEIRKAELVAKLVIKKMDFLLWGSMKKYRGIHAKAVARAMQKLVKLGVSTQIVESDQLAKIASTNN